jgi:hypothetical protein
MIEDDRIGEGISGEVSYVCGIIVCPCFPRCPGNKNRGDRVVAGISVGIRISMKLSDECYIEGRFFFCLPYGRVFKGFAIIDKPAGKGPTNRFILSFDQDNPGAVALDNDIDRRDRISIPDNFVVTKGAPLFHHSHATPILPMIVYSDVCKAIEQNMSRMKRGCI